MIWPIFKKYQGATEIIVMIDRPHARKIKDPLQAMRSLFGSFRASYLLIDPELARDAKWAEALEYAKEQLKRNKPPDSAGCPTPFTGPSRLELSSRSCNT